MASSDTLPHEPGLFEITLGVLLSVSLGGLLACILLVTRPVEKVRELPEEPVAGAVYYVPGSGDSTAGRQWMRKREAFVAKQAGDMALIEDELNAWARAAFQDDGDDKGKDKAAEGESMMPSLQTNTPNFRIRDGLLQIGFECSFKVYGTSKPLIVQMSGDVQKSGDKFGFVPRDVWVGGFHASAVPGVGSLVAGRLLGSIQLPDELTTPWAALSGARVDGQQLILSMP